LTALFGHPVAVWLPGGLLLYLSFILTISVSPIGWIFTRFSAFGSAMAVNERSEPEFSIPQGMLPQQPIFFLQFGFHVVTPKRREMGI